MNAASNFENVTTMLRRFLDGALSAVNPYAPAARQIRTEVRDPYLGADAWPGAVPVRLRSRR
jgi:hypothetical protein